jgi:hypothetical protein
VDQTAMMLAVQRVLYHVSREINHRSKVTLDQYRDNPTAFNEGVVDESLKCWGIVSEMMTPDPEKGKRDD